MVLVNILEAEYRLVWNEVEVENEREQWDGNNSYSLLHKYHMTGTVLSAL